MKETELLELDKQNCIIRSMCQALCDEYPSARYGLAHVVVDDWNFDDHFLDTCSADVTAALTTATGNRRELEATAYVLQAIRAFPRSVRCLPSAYSVDDDGNVIADDGDMTY